MDHFYPAGEESDASNDDWDIGWHSEDKAICIQDVAAVVPQGEDDVSAFKRAINKGDVDTVELLLNNGSVSLFEEVNLEEFEELKLSGVPQAGAQKITFCAALEQTCIDVETRLGFGWTPLMYAVSVANYDLSKLLLDRGANASFSKDCWTVLMASCAASTSEDEIARCVELLLTRNADPNMVDRAQMTCLMLAARDGYSKVINLLVSHGAEINAQESKGYTALSIAVQYGREEAVLKLLQLGADKTIRTKSGKSPADLAVAFKRTQIDKILSSSSHISAVQAYGPMDEALLKFFKTSSECPSSKESVNRLDELELFLHGLDLGYLTDVMTEHDITWSQLLTMEKEDFEKFGIADPVDQQKILNAIQQMQLDKIDLNTVSQLGATVTGSEDLQNFLLSVSQQSCYLTETIQDVISRFPRQASQLVFSLDPKKEAQTICNRLVIQTKDLQKEVTCLRNLLCQMDEAKDCCRLPQPSPGAGGHGPGPELC